MPWNFIRVPGKICFHPFYMAWTKVIEISEYYWILQVGLAKFSVNLSDFYRFKQKIIRFYKIEINVTKLNETSQNLAKFHGMIP